MSHLTKQDVAHLKDGDEVTVRMRDASRPDDTFTITGIARGDEGGQRLAVGHVLLRRMSGEPSSLLLEVISPKPPLIPVGQRRRSPEGVEVVKTDGVSALCWQRYAGVGKTWFSDDAIADWQIVTDLLVGTLPEAPECEREHLPEGHVPITFNGWSDDDLRVSARVVGSGALGAAIRAELTNRGASS